MGASRLQRDRRVLRILISLSDRSSFGPTGFEQGLQGGLEKAGSNGGPRPITLHPEEANSRRNSLTRARAGPGHSAQGPTLQAILYERQMGRHDYGNYCSDVKACLMSPIRSSGSSSPT